MPKNRPKKGANKGRQRNRNADRRRTRATRDVQLDIQPRVDLLNQQLQQAQEDYLRMDQSAQSIYGGATDALRGIPSPDFGGIADDLQARLTTLAGAFQGGDLQAGMPGLAPAELEAGGDLGIAIGAGGLENLASFDARNAAAQQGAQRESVLSGRYARDNLLQQMQDTIDSYNQQLGNVYAQMPSLIGQRADELRREGLESKLAMSKVQGDKAFSQWLQDYMGGQVGGFGGGGGGGRVRPRGGDGGGAPGQFTGGMGGYGGGPGSPAGPTGSTVPNQGWRQAILETVRDADYVNELPGWVRYAYNHEGAQSLQDPARRRLYKRKIRPMLRRFGPPGGPAVEIPGPFN